MKESLRYLNNAKEILKSIPLEDNTYVDVKPVQEACATAYLAVLKAIDEYLLKRGVEEDKLPASVDGYRRALQKYVSVHNGRLLKSFEALYRELHIAGYYRSLLIEANVIKEVLRSAKVFIASISSFH